MTSQKQIRFNCYQLLHKFTFGDSLKHWVNEDNFTDHFYDDWNILMMTVDKIESLHDGVFTVETKSRICSIYKNGKAPRSSFSIISKIKKNKILSIDDSKIVACYKACVRFIEIYNEDSVRCN